MGMLRTWTVVRLSVRELWCSELVRDVVRFVGWLLAYAMVGEAVLTALWSLGWLVDLLLPAWSPVLPPPVWVRTLGLALLGVGALYLLTIRARRWAQRRAGGQPGWLERWHQAVLARHPDDARRLDIRTLRHAVRDVPTGPTRARARL